MSPTGVVATRCEFIVAGEPVPWQRAGTNGNRRFLPPASADFRQRVWVGWTVGGRRFVLGAVRAEVVAVFARPPSHLLKGGALRKGAAVYPRADVDNVAKAVLDALNDNAYHDDSQIVELTVSKRYVDRGEEPHTAVVLAAV